MNYILILVLYFFSAAVFSQMPEEGTYRITKDKITIKNEQWSLYCSTHNVSVKSSKNESVKLKNYGKEWKAKGSTRRFGSKTCEGRNKTLQAVSRSKKNGVSNLKCESKRVTLGTEKGTQKVWFKNDKLFVESKSILYFKDRGDDCVSSLFRVTEAIYTDKKETLIAETPKCEDLGQLSSMKISPKVLLIKANANHKQCLKVTMKDKNLCEFNFRDLPEKLKSKMSIQLEEQKNIGFDNNLCFTLKNNIETEMLMGVTLKYDGVAKESTLHLLPKKQNKASKSWRELAKKSKSPVVKRILAEVIQGEISINQIDKSQAEFENEPEDNGLITYLLLFTLLILFGVITFILLKRKTKVILEEADDNIIVDNPILPKSEDTLICPECNFQFPSNEHQICPFDGEKLIKQEYDKIVRKTMFIPAAGGTVCPECHSKYPKNALFCGKDGNPLLPDFGQYNEST